MPHDEQKNPYPHDEQQAQPAQPILHVSKDGQERMQFHGDLQAFLYWLEAHKDIAEAFEGVTLQRDERSENPS